MFKKAVTIAALAASYALLNGCASMQSAAKYDSDHSRAYNLSTAAGLEQGIRDYDKPKTGTGSLANSGEYGAAFTAAGYYIPYEGMSGLASGGLNLVSWLLQPEDQFKRTSFFAWMPKEMARDDSEAQVKMHNIVNDAVEKTVLKMGFTFQKVVNKEEEVDYFIYSKKYGCPKPSGGKLERMCVIETNISEPYEHKAPKFIRAAHNGKPSYEFSVERSRIFNHVRLVEGSESHIPSLELYQHLSKNLPDWAFIYIAPDKVKLPNGKRFKAPYLLEHGKPLFYVI